jgi:hypothetical protein
MGPIDYTVKMPDPLGGFKEGLSIGDALFQRQANMELNRGKLALAQQENELAQQKFEAEQARQAKINALYAKLSKPGATTQDYMELAMVLPKEQSDALREAFKTMKEEERQAALTDTANVFSAFQMGDTTLAASLIRDQAKAYRDVGNEAAAKVRESFADRIEADPNEANAVSVMYGYMLSGFPGGEKTIDAITKLATERRAAADWPTLHEEKVQALAKAKSEAEKAAIEAQFLEREKILGLEKSALENGLTKEEITKTIAETRKLGAETTKIFLDLATLAKTKGLTPEKVIENEQALRKEYFGRVSSFQTAQQMYDKILRADNSGAGDVSLVYSFMKMLDEGSVVRESEYAAARDTAGLYQQLANTGEKLKSGAFLSKEQRETFKRLAGEYVKSGEAYVHTQRKQFEKLVDDYGLDRGHVLGEEQTPSELMPLRQFVSKQNPAVADKINLMTEEEIKAAYPQGYAAYSRAAQPVVTGSK